MQLTRPLGAMDWERVIVVPIFLFLLVASSYSLFHQRFAAMGQPTGDLMVVYRVLLAAFYVLSVFLLLTRSAAKAKSGGVLPRVAAYAGTFAPLLFGFVGAQSTSDSIEAGVAIQVAGSGFAVYSLATLRRSFGLAPQVRTLVRTGPYRYIRHPLYVGELVSLAGVVVVSPSWQRLSIWVAIAAIQGYRAIQEERLLATHELQYASYMRTTKRFIPGLF